MTKDREVSAPLRKRLARLYFGETIAAIRFQLTLALIDIAIITFFLLGPYMRERPGYLIVDYLIAIWIAAELLMQMVISPNVRRWLLRPMTWVDLLVLGTLLFPQLLFSFAFLRALRIWAIAQRPIFTIMLRRFGWGHMTDVATAVVNFIVFLFTVTGFVYTFFFYRVDGGEGFVDAFYFTVATVTTTGFGDITLPGTFGKLTSIVTMIIGISLFVRLAQAIVRPYKVSFPCPKCGLQRHDADAVHCKACGHILNIPDEGL
ncbi:MULTISPECIES: potassium channel family protein [Alphaproteobacteria]|uniref:Ion transporter n=2 Tax=Alphaproteobacteria TaxID=28211 RepID=A0A512HEZ1_9HYPH|nr:MULTISPECIES: potassium channel family protein [Alphaproteobacteria]GEO84022.1 ion transporter [Ciceribacter naphthalenivorans]GLR21100.1 ion transporter [Ciceribacter naphthalenivorans]GLT03956.1 ion transporter [Sphingomonas psychrolutea]